MKKKLLALVALLSFYQAFVKPAVAQQAHEPPTQPTEIKGGGSITTTHSPSEVRTGGENEVFAVGAKETVDSVIAADKSVTIEGTVRHDVVVTDCDVTIAKGAKIGGTVIANGGTLRIHQDGVHVVQDSASEVTGASDVREISLPNGSHYGSQTTIVHSPLIGNIPSTSWCGAQWGLFLFGIVSTFVLTLIAPKATKQATDTVVFEPGRSLVVGLIAGLLAISVLLVNAALVRSPLGLLYAPFGAVVALVPLAVVVAGWLCGMRLVGDWAAQRFGKPTEGNLFARITLGLGLFLLVKLIVGGSMLGSATLFFEGMIALLGTGALLITGFGSRPDWLGARLRGESRWFGGKRF